MPGMKEKNAYFFRYRKAANIASIDRMTFCRVGNLSIAFIQRKPNNRKTARGNSCAILVIKLDIKITSNRGMAILTRYLSGQR